MPAIESHLRAAVEGTCVCDVDVGECFLNFPMHPSLQKHCGVDLTPCAPNFDKLETLPDRTRGLVVVAWQ